MPEQTYVSDLVASRLDKDLVYAAFNNHKNGDFKPYLLRSADRGRSWTSIAADLPERGTVWTIVEDTVERELLFVGTEFGLFFSLDGGKKWLQLKGGLPTIPVRDLAIQKRENDLVVATFGRGFYVLDDLTPLRVATPALLRDRGGELPGEEGARLRPADPAGPPRQGLPGRDALHRAQPAVRRRLHLLPEGGGEDEAQGAARRREGGRQEGRRDRLPDARGAARGGARGGPRGRPDREGRGRQRRAPAERPREGRHPARRLGPPLPGRQPHPPDARSRRTTPSSIRPTARSSSRASYSVSFEKRVDGAIAPLAEPQSFVVESLGLQTLKAQDGAALLAFQRKTARLQRAVLGAVDTAEEAQTRLKAAKKALDDTPAAAPALGTEARRIERALDDLLIGLRGDRVLGVAQRADADVDLRPRGRDRRHPVVGHRRADGNQPQGLRRRRGRLREAARHAADARRDRPRRARGRDGEGGRALDPGPRADLGQGVEAAAARYCRTIPVPVTLNSSAAVTPAGSPSRTTFVSFVPLSEMSSSTGWTLHASKQQVPMSRP